MHPRSSLDDVTNSTNRGTKLFCNSAITQAGFFERSDFNNFRFRKSSTVIFGTFSSVSFLSENLMPMYEVLRARYHLKIHKLIFWLNSILVIYLQSISKICKKMLSHESMNHSRPAAIFAQNNLKISTAVKTWSHNSIAAQALDVSKITNFIQSFVTDNWLPRFHFPILTLEQGHR